MKKVRNLVLGSFLSFVFVIASCGSPTPEVITVVVTATNPPVEAATATPDLPPAPVALGGPQNGETIKWIDGSVLVYIPAGNFTMGDGGFDAPMHSVSLDGYWIQQTKVTNRMYDQCVKAGVCTPPNQELGGPVFTNPEYASHPVVGVSWDQSQAYCSWIQGNLPTEAQWEKAARGVNGNTYPWGNSEPTCGVLNFANCYGRTTNVDTYAEGKSPFGLYDMAGNVFEWIFDLYDANYYNQRRSRIQPVRKPGRIVLYAAAPSKPMMNRSQPRSGVTTNRPTAAATSVSVVWSPIRNRLRHIAS